MSISRDSRLSAFLKTTDPLRGPSPAARTPRRRSGSRGPRTAAGALAPGGVCREAGPARPLPAVGSFRHEPGPGDADEAPERGEDDDREGEGVSRHGGARDAQIGVLGQLQMLPDPGGLVGAKHAHQDQAASGSALGGPPCAGARARILWEEGPGEMG